MNCRAIGFAVAAVLLTVGCGSGPVAVPEVTSSPGRTAGADYNDTDLMFLRMMIAREQEASQLTQPARSRRLPAEVSTLVAAIRSTQADESRIMKSWLRDWKRPVQMDQSAGAHAHHGGLEQLSPADLADLDQAAAEEYPTRFLNLLIAQQHIAVELARMETGSGIHPEARDLARRVDQSRTAQISAMLAMVANGLNSPV